MWANVWNSVLNYASLHVDILTSSAWDIAKILALFIGARIVIFVSSGLTTRLFHHDAVRMNNRRRETLTYLLHNIVRYTVYFIFIMMSLQTLHFHIGTLLAGAGIAGLAIGFGAQNIIKDLFSGFFILFEDQYAVGDYVTINGQTGTIKQIGIRLTQLQIWTGEMVSIPNGLIEQVTNYSRTNSLAVIDVGVNYATDLRQALDILNQIMMEEKETNADIVGAVNVLGVQALEASDILLRVTAECNPTTQYSVRRMVYLKIKEAFDAAGIDIPVPQQVVEIKNPEAFTVSHS